VIRDDDRGIEQREERDDEEYYFIHPQRSPSETSESVTLNFPTDDRVHRHGEDGKPLDEGGKCSNRPRFYEYVEEEFVDVVEREQVAKRMGITGPT